MIRLRIFSKVGGGGTSYVVQDKINKAINTLRGGGEDGKKEEGGSGWGGWKKRRWRNEPGERRERGGWEEGRKRRERGMNRG